MGLAFIPERGEKDLMVKELHFFAAVLTKTQTCFHNKRGVYHG